MSTHVPGFQTFLRCLHHFVLAKLDTSSIRVKSYGDEIETRNSEEIPFSSRIVVSVAEGSQIALQFLSFFASFCIGKIN